MSQEEKEEKISKRRKEILAYLQGRGNAKMKDFLAFFQGKITERTLRNDLKFLVKRGLIKKQGGLNKTKYFI